MSYAWSKSSLGNVLDGCSWQWALEKVYGMPSGGSPHTARGTAMHAGIEMHERRRIVLVRDGIPGSLPSQDEVTDYAMGVLHDELHKLPPELIDMHGMSWTSLEDNVEAMIDNWWSAPIREGQPGAGASVRDRVMAWRPVAVEPYIEVDLTDTHRVKGFIDALLWDYDARQWVVVDQKSATGYGRWPLDGTGHEVEAGVYVLGSEVARNMPTNGSVRMEWHVMRPEKGTTSRYEPVRVVQLQVQEYHRQYLLASIDRANLIVEHEAFRPNPDWNLCSPKWCAHYQGCQVTGELAPGGRGLPLVR